MKLLSETAVVTAGQFNPSLFSQLFLVRIGIASEKDFVGPIIQTPGLSQLATHQFELLVTADRLQIVPKGERPEAKSEVIREVVWKIVSELPHTPYTAVGLNFNWAIATEDPEATTRRLFFKADGVLAGEFDSPDARFGSYFSKNVFGARLRLNVKPIILNPDRSNHLQMDFNFDKQLPEGTPLETLRETLVHWDEARDYATRLAEIIEAAR